MRNSTRGFRDLLSTLWNAVAGWLFFTLLLILVIGGIGINRFITLQRAIVSLEVESSELQILRALREDILALETASRFSGQEKNKPFSAQLKESEKRLTTHLESLKMQVSDTAALMLIDSMGYLIAARTKQLSTLLRLKEAQADATMPESLLNEVEDVLAGRYDSTILIRLDRYIQRRQVPVATDDVLPDEQGKRNLLQQFKDFFGGKKRNTTTAGSQEEVILTDSVLQIEPLQADRRAEVRALLEEARRYNSQLLSGVQKREISLRESGQLLQMQLNRLTEVLERQFLNEQQKRATQALKLARSAANMLALISACGLALGLILMLYLRKLLRLSAEQQKMLDAEQKKVADLVKARQELLSRISHELRTPLQAIAGFSEQLAAAPAGKQKRWLAFIKQSSRQLSFLIGQLLQFNQLSLGKAQLLPEVFSLSGLIDEVDEIYKARCTEKQLHWELLSNLTDTFSVRTDPYRLRQILFNLLDNAVKFTRTGGVCLEVDKSEDQLIFRIIDTGVGMDSADLTGFEAYKQHNPATDQAKGGIGLGLHLVSQLITLLDGKLTIESQPGEGSTFLVELPVLFMSETEETEQQLPETQFPLRLLIVDDDPLNIELMQQFLEPRVALLEACLSAEKALEIAGNQNFDLVITDRRLPGMEGPALAVALLAKDEKLSVYLMTAAVSEEDFRNYLRAGIIWVLEKPFESEQLHRILREESLRRFPNLFIRTERMAGFLEDDIAAKGAFLQRFKQDTLNLLSQLEQALSSADRRGLQEGVHQLATRLQLFDLPFSPSLREMEALPVNEPWPWQATARLHQILALCRTFLQHQS